MTGIREALANAATSLESGDGGGEAAGDQGGGITGDSQEASGLDASAVETTPGGEPEVRDGTGEVAGSATPSAAQRARDASGKFTKAEVKAQAAAKASAAVAVRPQPPISATPKPPAPGTIPKPAEPSAAPAPEVLKAPQSWKPAEREKWGSLAPEAQQAITRRERETAIALQEAAPARKFHQDFQATVGPYEGLIRASGAEPMQMIGTLLQTGAQLRHGTPQTKADVAAAIIAEYGVPIELLAAAIDRRQGGQPQAQQQQAQVDPQQFRDPRIDQMIAQRARETEQRARSEISTFGASHEFFEDVRPKMEGLLRSGLAENLEDAYAQACKLHPDISGVVEQRKAAEAAKAAMASTQRARAASTSVRPQPAGVTAPQPKGIRATLAEAAAKLGK